MRIRCFRYRTALSAPIPVSGFDSRDREGLLICCESGGRCLWGEAAPLTGLSRETLDGALDDIRAIVHGLKSPALACPSVRFAWQSFQLVPGHRHVAIAALLSGSPADVLRQATLLADTSWTTVKLKIGRSADPLEDARLVRQVRQRLRTDQQLRLDANRAWDRMQAKQFAAALDGASIAFIEEPLKEPHELESWYAESGLPYALDETLRETRSLVSFPNAAALIVKPTLLGGTASLDRLSEAGIPLIYSACFESGVGIWNVACLASQHAPQRAAGLDTYRWLTDDLLRSPLDMSDGTLSLTEPPVVDVRRAQLQEVDL
jgi:O-succinylbenzoate synthase